MTPKLSLILTGVAALIALAVALIAISLCIAAALPRGHPAADALRRFAGKVPRLAIGAGMSVYALGLVAFFVLFPVLTILFS
jgi:hypothetical protein